MLLSYTNESALYVAAVKKAPQNIGKHHVINHQ